MRVKHIYYGKSGELNITISSQYGFEPKKFCICSYRVDNNWYMIDSSNNTIIYDDAGGGGPYTSTISEGNYTASTLAAALQTAMSANIAAITVTYSTLTNKLTFTDGVNAVDLTYAGSTIAPVIGLTDDVSAVGATPQEQINLYANKNLFLCSKAIMGLREGTLINGENDFVLLNCALPNAGESVFERINKLEWLELTQRKYNSIDIYAKLNDTVLSCYLCVEILYEY